MRIFGEMNDVPFRFHSGYIRAPFRFVAHLWPEVAVEVKRTRATVQRSRSSYGYKKRGQILEAYGYYRPRKTEEEREAIRSKVDDKLKMLKAKGLTCKATRNM